MHGGPGCSRTSGGDGRLSPHQTAQVGDVASRPVPVADDEVPGGPPLVATLRPLSDQQSAERSILTDCSRLAPRGRIGVFQAGVSGGVADGEQHHAAAATEHRDQAPEHRCHPNEQRSEQAHLRAIEGQSGRHDEDDSHAEKAGGQARHDQQSGSGGGEPSSPVAEPGVEPSIWTWLYLASRSSPSPPPTASDSAS